MSEKLEQLIKSLPEPEFPENLHLEIMKKIKIFRVAKWIRFGMIISTANIAAATFYFVTQLVKNDAFLAIKLFFQNFEANLLYFRYVGELVISSIPPLPFTAFFLSVAAAITLAGLFLHLNHKISRLSSV